ncbi:MAG: hypothetical protein NZ740_03100 [Kiritimatiellae bacterium]|nr:hypothetical protein [Kiritimatiellia bacterium]MDW8458079.1 hypothetical protein [Verrucomicrobiota bacterium]
MNTGAARIARACFWRGVAVTVAFHAAAAALFIAVWPPIAPAKPNLTPSRLTAWIDSAESSEPDIQDDDPRLLWSPVLFALPIRPGFSPRPLKPPDYLSGVLPLDRPGPVLERIDPGAGQPPMTPRAVNEARRALAAHWRKLEGISDPFRDRAATAGGLFIDWPDGSPGWQSGLPLDAPELNSGSRPWEASVSVSVSTAGDVVSVFLTQPTPDRERNEALVRAFRRLRAVPGREGHFRATVYYIPTGGNGNSSAAP